MSCATPLQTPSSASASFCSAKLERRPAPACRSHVKGSRPLCSGSSTSSRHFAHRGRRLDLSPETVSLPPLVRRVRQPDTAAGRRARLSSWSSMMPRCAECSVLADQQRLKQCAAQSRRQRHQVQHRTGPACRVYCEPAPAGCLRIPRRRHGAGIAPKSRRGCSRPLIAGGGDDAVEGAASAWC